MTASRFRIATVLVLLLTAVVRLIYVWYVTFAIESQEVFDYEFYIYAADTLCVNGTYPPTGHWMPGYPLFLSIVFSLVGSSAFAARLANIGLAVLTCLLLIRWTKVAYGRPKVALAAATVYALFPWFVILCGYAASENLYVALVMVIACISQSRQITLQFALLLGILFGVTILTRAEGVVLVGICCCSYVMLVGTQSQRQRIRRCMLTLMMTAATLAPWIVRNYHFFGRFIPFSTSAGGTFLDGNNEFARGRDTTRQWSQIFPKEYWQLSGKEEPIRSKLAGDVALRWIHDNPTRYTGLLFLKIREVWNIRTESLFRGDGHGNPILDRWVPVLACAAFFAFSVIGLIYQPPQSGASVFFWIILVHTHVLTLIFFANDRYRTLLMVFLCPTAILGILNLSKLFSDTRSRRLRQPLICAVLLAALATGWLGVLTEYVPRLRF